VSPENREIDSYLMRRADGAHGLLYDEWSNGAMNAAGAALESGLVVSVDVSPEDVTAVVALLGGWLAGQPVTQSIVSWYDPARERLYVRGKTAQCGWAPEA
jgi:hypothetical protein